MRPFALVAVAGIAATGCGSANEPPPAARPPDSPPLERRPAGRVVPAGQPPDDLTADPRRAAVGRGLVAVVDARARRVGLYDVVAGREAGSAVAGVGPTNAVAARGLVYVADTLGDAILVYTLRPRFQFLDRANLSGSPYGLAVDRRRGRLWATLTARNELVRFRLTGHAPRRVATYPTVRQPNRVAVDERTGRVFVASRRTGQLQILGNDHLRQQRAE